MISSSRKIVILVLPFSVTTGPLFPLEKSYSFLISTHLFGFRFANGDDSLIVSTMGIYDNSQMPESICANRNEPLFAFSQFTRFALDSMLSRVCHAETWAASAIETISSTL